MEPFEFPRQHLEIGDSVFCWPSPAHKASGQPPVGLIITSIGNESIEGSFHFSVSTGFGYGNRSGVRHIDDPLWADQAAAAAMIEANEGGCFELHPKTLKMIALEKAVFELEQTVTELRMMLSPSLPDPRKLGPSTVQKHRQQLQEVNS